MAADFFLQLILVKTNLHEGLIWGDVGVFSSCLWDQCKLCVLVVDLIQREAKAFGECQTQHNALNGTQVIKLIDFVSVY